MSDEEKVISNQLRIEGLEKRLSNLEDLFYVPNNRLEELEKKLNDGFDEINKFQKTTVDMFRKQQEQIAELKELFDKHDCFKSWQKNIKVFDIEKLDSLTLPDPYYACGKEKDSGDEKESRVDCDSEEGRKMKDQCRSNCDFYKADHSACHYCEDWRHIKDEKLPECSECGGFRMGENIIHIDWCSQSPTTTTAEKLPKEVIFPGIYDYIKAEPEKELLYSLDDMKELKEIAEERVRGATRKELIEEIQDDLDSLNESPGIPYSYEPLNELKEKWGKKRG